MADSVELDATDPTIPASAEPTATTAPTRDAKTDVNSIIRRKTQQCRRIRREFIPEWSTNIDYRRAKPFDTDSDQDRVAITADWANTKRKQAQLFSQVPKVRLKTRRRWAKQIPPQARIAFQSKVNDELEDINVGAVMDECMANVINAAGICAIMVSFEKRTEDRDMLPPSGPVPGLPVMPAAGAPGNGAPLSEPGPEAEMAEQGQGGEPPAPPGPPGAPEPPKPITMPYTTAKRFDMRSISPADLIWDVSFTGSDWNKIPLIGESGRIHWGQAIKEFGQSEENPNGLTELDKDTVCGRDDRNDLDMLTHQADRQRYKDSDIVSYDQIFYRRFYFDENETSFEAIQRVVFVRGRSGGKPVIDELWTGQKRVRDDEGGVDAIVGSCKYPIQVGTLTYISDEAIPPSDTAMGRPQIDELSMGRSMMMAQRRFSLPWRWFNNNLVPPEIVTQLMRGEWQGAVPLNGSGDKVMGEVARAQYPREDFEFDRVAKAELDATWNLGTSLSGGGSGNTQVRSAAEAEAVQSNLSTVMAMDRAKVIKLFCNSAEVLAGMMALYADFTPDEMEALGAWDREKFASYFIFSVRGDASVLLDAGQRLAKLERFWNQTAKSGMVDEVPILQEMASLNDIDEELVHPPAPPPPPKMNISLRLGAEELNNPIFVAMLMGTGQFPDAKALAAAKQAIIQANALPQPEIPLPGGPGGPEQPMGMTVHPPAADHVPVPHPPVTDVMPHLNEADRVNKRTHDGK
jgi:hypothetical protein